MPTIDEIISDAAASYDRIYFRTQPGNAGDGLINAGFYCLAQRLGLDYTEFSGSPQALPGRSPADLVILTGGGSLSEHYDFGAPALREWTAQEGPLLLLPSSLNGNAEALRTLRACDTLVVRDRYSHDFASSLGLDCTLLLADDVAFSVDPAWVLRTSPWRRPRTIDQWRRLVAFAQHRLRAARGETLQAWRVDAESARHRPGARRRDDLSELASYGCSTRADNLYSAQWLLRVCGWYRRVETDRLHLGVACMLMGTPVRMHGNDHHKIRGVVEQSIAPVPERAALVEYVEPCATSAKGSRA